nr:TlpA disulfide reductase family protein [uncultured Capnocytophaga sp.]
MKKSILLLLTITLATLSGAKAQELQRHKPVPTINLPGTNGEHFDLSAYKGKYVLIDFWASWCTPCRKESKYLRKAYETYKDKNFTILSVSVDKPTDKERWKEAIVADQYSWMQVLDDKKTSESYGVKNIPAAFLIDPDGNLLTQGDTLRGEQLEKTLQKYLK